MPEGNAEVIRAAIAHFSERGVDGLDRFYASDVVHRAIVGAPDDVGEMHGWDALAAYFQDWFDMFDDLSQEVEEIRDAGDDQVVAQQLGSGRAKLSGVTTELRYWVVYTLRDGLIVESREYADLPKALAAAGLAS